ncbi:zinc-ribbon domain-containing protein [Lapillicoccus sp.]|uniref:zinc ribbon domain-containing protein n=1 Tax=Lapillicoccus sp. TaxID=1909287 RepID=UPI0025FA6D78|nr:zinc-ribbon domain-containing protein [Lapillicoccus sp.]
MTAHCSLCGAPLAPDARFCAQCGTPVAPAAVAAPPVNPYERPAAGVDEEYYPEDFPDHLSADAGRQVLAGGSYPTEPPSPYAPPAYGAPGSSQPGYSQPGYGPADYGPDLDEPTYAAGGFAGRDEGLGSPWQEPDGERSRALLIGGAALVGLLVLIGLVYFLLFRPASSPTASLPAASASASAPRATTPPPVAGGATPKATAPPSPSQAAYPAVALPAGSTVCPAVATGAYAHVAAGNSSTSCEFAAAVRAAYEPVAAPGGSVTVQATSPRTGKTYSMTCSGNQPVLCTGGNNAQVILYGGTPTTP